MKGLLEIVFNEEPFGNLNLFPGKPWNTKVKSTFPFLDLETIGTLFFYSKFPT